MNTAAPGHHPMASDSAGLRDAEELALIAAGFPGFAIWRSVTANGGRYVAQGLDLRAHPHGVVTDDLAELVAALTAGQGPGRPTNPGSSCSLLEHKLPLCSGRVDAILTGRHPVTAAAPGPVCATAACTRSTT